MKLCRAGLAGIAIALAACASNRGTERARPAVPALPAPSASTAAADAGPVPVRGAAIGSAHPLVVLAASASAHWVAFCQARQDTNGDGAISVTVGAHGALSGDRLEPTLALADGRLRPIDSLAAVDPSGRYVVIASGGKLVLIDTPTGAETDLSALGADLRADALPNRSHRALAFDAEGRALAFVQRTATAERVVVRELPGGKQVLVTPEAGSVWRIELERTGRWVVLHQITNDSDADGRLRWPAPESAANASCASPIAALPSWTPRGDPVSIALAPRAGGAAKRVDGFVTSLAAGLVTRETDGRLLLRGQADVELSPASCGARILHADPTRNLLVIACAAVRGRPPLELVGPGRRQPLDVDVAFLGHDLVARDAPRLVPLYPGGETALLDLDTGRLLRQKTGDIVVVTSGARALLHRGDRLIVSDVTTGTETTLPGTTLSFARPLRAGEVAVVAPLVAHAGSGRLLGRVDADPLALARDGRVLIAQGGPTDADRLATGPLVWLTPVPVAATDTSR